MDGITRAISGFEGRQYSWLLLPAGEAILFLLMLGDLIASGQPKLKALLTLMLAGYSLTAIWMGADGGRKKLRPTGKTVPAYLRLGMVMTSRVTGRFASWLQ